MRALGCALLICFSFAASAAEIFGDVTLVEGEVRVITPGGSVRSTVVGDVVTEGSTIITGSDGEVHIETMDHGLVALRPNTRLRVDEYRPEEGRGRQVLSLVQGTFRSLSGWIGRDNPDGYVIRTPTATMGIRGTDHEPAYWPEAIAGEIGEEAGTYDRVNEGRTFIRNELGTVELGPDETGFVGRKKTKPRRLGAKPGFYRGGKHEKRIVEKRQRLKDKIAARKQRGAKLQQHEKRGADKARTGERRQRPSGKGKQKH